MPLITVTHNPCFLSFDQQGGKKKETSIIKWAHLAKPETVSPPLVPDKEDTLGSIVPNKDQTMRGDASDRSLSATLHVRSANQHRVINMFSIQTVTQVTTSWFACLPV